ncbi:MAG: asparagine synthase C-terminal domain-containing protein [Thermoplasmata archaeon]
MIERDDVGRSAGARWTGAGGVLDRAFEAAMRPWKTGDGPLAILFSGGVDSGLLAWELRTRPATALFTVGLPGSLDLEAAGASAKLIGGHWIGATLSDEGLRRILGQASGDLAGLPTYRQSIFLALAAAVERAPAPDLLCGQGADELFLGYAHFRGLGADAAATVAAADLDRLRREDWPQTQQMAERLGHRIHAPFLDPGFVRAALDIPIEERMPRPVPKALFRRWARDRGVPSAIADRPKRALQYGTGIDAWLRRSRGPPGP